MAAKKRSKKKKRKTATAGSLKFLAARVKRLEEHAGITHRTKKQRREDSIMHGIGPFMPT